MFVKSIMIPKHECIMVDSNDTVQTALDKLIKYDIDSLPVTSNGIYEGILTRFGIYEEYFNSSMEKEEFMNSTKAGDIARRKDVYFHGEEIFEDVFLTLKSYSIVAVVDEQQHFVGIVTRFDVLEQFRSSFGVGKSGVRIAVACMEAEGQIAKLSDLSKVYHENIISLSTFDETDKFVRRIVLKVEKTKNLDKFLQKLEQSGFKILHIQEV